MSEDRVNVERIIASAKEDIKMLDALNKLANNPSFKKVITEGYFKDYASQMVTAKAAPSCRGADMQAEIIKNIDGIGSLQQYFSMIFQKGELAAKDVADGEETLESLHAEELGE